MSEGPSPAYSAQGDRDRCGCDVRRSGQEHHRCSWRYRFQASINAHNEAILSFTRAAEQADRDPDGVPADFAIEVASGKAASLLASRDTPRQKWVSLRNSASVGCTKPESAASRRCMWISRLSSGPRRLANSVELTTSQKKTDRRRRAAALSALGFFLSRNRAKVMIARASEFSGSSESAASANRMAASPSLRPSASAARPRSDSTSSSSV